MKKRKKTTPNIGTPSPSLNGHGAPVASDEPAKPTACCGCAAKSAGTAALEGVGPGAHAAGVDSGLKTANLKHLKRIEGQVRGIAAMIEQDRYCTDIIQQCAAVQESLRSVARNLYKNHLLHCAARAMHDDGEQRREMIDELVELVGKIAR